MGKIIDWFKARKQKFKNSKWVMIFSAYISARLNSKVEIMMRSFGGLLTAWTVAIAGSLVALVTGLPPNWGVSLSLGIGATSLFLVQLYRIAFGKPKTNGNGNGEPVDKPDGT